MIKKKLNGKTALITGSTRKGIGATTALTLAHYGANIILNYGTGSKGEAASKRAAALEKIIKKFNKNVLTIAADVTQEKDVQKLFSSGFKKFGSVDILVNNAGGTWIPQDFAQIKTSHFKQATRPEIEGTFFCIREALPLMRKKRWGRIINICLDLKTMELSLGETPDHILDKYPYDFALAKYTKQHLTELISPLEFKYGITCNNILPGIIEEMSNEEALEIIQGKREQSFFFNPLDVAETIAYLCSEEARSITNSNLNIPGNLYKRI